MAAYISSAVGSWRSEHDFRSFGIGISCSTVSARCVDAYSLGSKACVPESVFVAISCSQILAGRDEKELLGLPEKHESAFGQLYVNDPNAHTASSFAPRNLRLVNVRVWQLFCAFFDAFLKPPGGSGIDAMGENIFCTCSFTFLNAER